MQFVHTKLHTMHHKWGFIHMVTRNHTHLKEDIMEKAMCFINKSCTLKT